MSLQIQDLRVAIAVSNMDLYPVGLRGCASWGSTLEQLVPYLEETGCRNFEIHPTAAIMQDIAKRQQSGDTEIVSRVIGSVHQSLNNGRGMLGRAADWRGIPRSQASIESMGVIAAVCARPIPAVYYPDNLPGDGTVPSNNMLYPVMQP